MKITRETDHATKCVLYLAQKPKEFIPANEIAVKNGIPRPFLAKILQKLTKAGILESQQGNQGGFKLKKEPSEICLYDIFKIIQGDMIINGCVVNNQFCDRVKFCSVHPVWVNIRKEIVDKLKKIDFQSLSKVEIDNKTDLG